MLSVIHSSNVSGSTDFYIGAKLGGSSLSYSCTVYDSRCTDDSGFNVGLLSEYKFNTYLSLGASFDWLGKYHSIIHSSNSLYETNSHLMVFSLSPKFSYPIEDSWDIYSRLGPVQLIYGNRKDISLNVGFGIEFDLTKRWRGHFEYQRINDINDDWFNADLESMWVGVAYNLTDDMDSASKISAQRPNTIISNSKSNVVDQRMKPITKIQYFSFNSIVLNSNAKSDLKSVADVLLSMPTTSATIVGYTDSVGSYKVNKRISELRANAVASYLRSLGVSPSKMNVFGYGESDPTGDNTTIEGRKKNRRVTVTIIDSSTDS
ncbi:OmpA family protein [Vibrio maritimus]